VVEVLGRYSNPTPNAADLRKLLARVSTAVRSVPVAPPMPKQVQHRLTPDEVRDVVAAYQAGHTIRDLAVQFGIHKETVREHLERAGVPRRINARKLTDQDVKTAAELYQQGLSLQGVGERLGVDAKTVMNELHRAGEPMRPRRGGRRSPLDPATL